MKTSVDAMLDVGSFSPDPTSDESVEDFLDLDLMDNLFDDLGEQLEQPKVTEDFAPVSEYRSTEPVLSFDTERTFDAVFAPLGGDQEVEPSAGPEAMSPEATSPEATRPVAPKPACQGIFVSAENLAATLTRERAESDHFPHRAASVASSSSSASTSTSSDASSLSKRKANTEDMPSQPSTKKRVSLMASINMENLSKAEIKRIKAERKRQRNRELAAESRERRKNYVESIEKQNKELQTKVADLEMALSERDKELERCRNSLMRAEAALKTQNGGSSPLSQDTVSLDGSESSAITSPDMDYEASEPHASQTLLKGATAMAMTVSMIMLSDTTSQSALTTSSPSGLISFWAVAWDMSPVSLGTIVPHFLAILFGVALTLLVTMTFYYRTLRPINRGMSVSLLPTAKPSRHTVPLRPPRECRRT
mmetsp:Transcript_3629/g.6340  ORF Transcript_3629/g.6340 Transcript_3629/m.6340 type:complete len:423 (+) Transcript_3629:244-1512(+)